MIGEEIKKARKAKKMSMVELASKVGVCPATICKIERGETKTIKNTVAVRLAETLELPSSLILGEADYGEFGEIYDKMMELGADARRLEEYCADSGDEELEKKATIMRKTADLFYEVARDVYETARAKT